MRKLKYHHWSARLLGLAPELFEQCSAHLKARGKVTFFAVLTIHAFTAFTISAGLHQFFPGLFPVLAFFGLFAVLFTADRLLITGTRHWTSTAMRLLLVVVLPLFNMAFFDLLFFDKDIRGLFATKQAETAGAIELRYAEQTAETKTEIAQLNGRNQALQDSIRSWTMLNIQERNGTGGSKEIGEGRIYQGQQQDIAFLQSSAEAEIRENVSAIGALESQLEAVQEKIRVEIAALPAFGQTGVAYRLGLLYEQLTTADQPVMKLFSAAYFLFFFFVDALLLLPAVYLPFGEYHERVKLSHRQQQLLKELRDTQLYQLQAAEIQHEIENKLLQLQHDAEIEHAQAELQNIERQLTAELQLIANLQKEDERIAADYQRDFQRLGHAALLKALDQLEERLATSQA
jgi:hypothetical protein